ncbi:PxORF29 peptide [Plutella xylostella granulovirus]|uniref:ORF29 protein n=1 Tax=Plutella xylostella granulovirus TaxID=98383 RepID=Q9DW02_9BBAC|nr:PxORF29 peptide [Plutella xylostella granulovirus]AAG27327.1 PxORF29 peptide [Plutella xylostella granulovirus]AMQ35641.1 PxGV-Corf29 protein [Plutella xylostella granulovirus]AMQ35758.1 PxGV-Korf29 protein [Plutella xylostella granulovirus]AMQ35875.1 PxGV-Morf29 protein [Plutella xylostella granulovirus]AMQ35992.1 PxGV-Torf29 protein [Plutella xylostella granulovirus]
MWLLFFLFITSLLVIYNSVQAATTDHRKVNLAFERFNNVIDCDKNRTPCITDAQCRDNCEDGVLMTCEQGFCGIKVQRETTFCDIERGMITVLEALNSFVVKETCISTYRDVIDDDSNLRPYVCEGGEMNINLEDGPFAVEDCQCRQGFTRFAYSQGAFSRTIPVCIPNRLATIYDRVYTK